MKKNDIIVVALLLALWFAWGPLDRHFFQKYFPQPEPAQQTETVEASDVPAVEDAEISEALEEPATQPELKPAPEKPEKPAKAEELGEDLPPETKASLSNDLLELTVSSRGGAIVSALLKDYPASKAEDSGPVEVSFEAERSLVLKDVPGIANRDLKLAEGEDGRSISFSTVTPDGIRYERSLLLGEGYVLNIEDRFFNETDGSLVVPGGAIILGEMATDTNQFVMRGMVYLGVDTLSPGGEKTKHWSKKLKGLFESKTQLEIRHAMERPVDWAAVKNKYFVQSLRPSEGGDDCIVIARRTPDASKIRSVAAEVLLSDITLAANESSTRSMELYIGPKKLSELKKVGYHQATIMELGWTAPIGKFLLASVNFIHDKMWPYNYGLAIILVTVIIRVIFWPITHKGTESMRRMGELQPLIKEVNEKYKDSPQKKQEAMMALYKEHKVNPMGGCMPMVIQIPVFFALFYVLRSAIELRFADFLWISDLSEPENLIQFGFALPLVGWDSLNILPILMSISMVWQQKLTPTASAGDEKQAQMQKTMMTVMPVMLLIFLYNMPAGLALYWTTQNVLMIVQQLVYRKRKAAKEAAAA